MNVCAVVGGVLQKVEGAERMRGWWVRRDDYRRAQWVATLESVWEVVEEAWV